MLGSNKFNLKKEVSNLLEDKFKLAEEKIMAHSFDEANKETTSINEADLEKQIEKKIFQSMRFLISNEVIEKLSTDIEAKVFPKLRKELRPSLEQNLETKIYNRVSKFVSKQVPKKLEAPIQENIQKSISKNFIPYLKRELPLELLPKLESSLATILENNLFSNLQEKLQITLYSHLWNDLPEPLYQRLMPELLGKLQTELSQTIISSFEEKLPDQIIEHYSSSLTRAVVDFLDEAWNLAEEQVVNQLELRIHPQIQDFFKTELALLNQKIEDLESEQAKDKMIIKQLQERQTIEANLNLSAENPKLKWHIRQCLNSISSFFGDIISPIQIRCEEENISVLLKFLNTPMWDDFNSLHEWIAQKKIELEEKNIRLNFVEDIENMTSCGDYLTLNFHQMEEQIVVEEKKEEEDMIPPIPFEAM